MTIPTSGQTVHLMRPWNILQVVLELHRKEGRNSAELRLYALDDLRRLYQNEQTDIIRLRDGIVSRIQLYALIRWRLWWVAAGWWFVTFLTLVAAVAAVIAAFEGWRPEHGSKTCSSLQDGAPLIAPDGVIRANVAGATRK